MLRQCREVYNVTMSRTGVTIASKRTSLALSPFKTRSRKGRPLHVHYLRVLVRSLTLVFALAVPQAGRAEVAYSLSPVMAGGKLKAVEVTVALPGDLDGRTVLELPDDFAGEEDRWRRLSDFRVSGAAIEGDGPGRRVLRSAPGAPITVRYRVATAYDADPTADEAIYKGPAIRPSWLYALGEFLFVKPAGRGAEPATFAWRGWPKGWGRASDADHWRSGRSMTVDDVLESTLLAGSDVAVITRSIAGATLRLAARGRGRSATEHYADVLARVLSVQRAFWGDVSEPFTVTLIPLPAVDGRSSAGGTGRSDGFGLWATPDVPEETLLYIMAHEHIHTWIPRRLGTRPEPEAAGYWLTEGFTDFYAQRTLLRAGIWTPEQFVADLNRVLFEYATSPVRNYPNSRIVADFWSDPRLTYLPYRRGAVFAYLADRELRRASGGKANLDTVVFAMRDRWAAAPASAKPAVVGSFVEEAERAGFDPRAAITAHVDAGKPILLPADLFPGCVSVSTNEIAVFDPGFDRNASTKTGAITGVEPAGPAHAAGLRDGMRRLGRTGGEEGDSRVPITYRVEDGGAERTITYKPEGNARLTVQTATMLPGLTSAQMTACARDMSGLLGR